MTPSPTPPVRMTRSARLPTPPLPPTVQLFLWTFLPVPFLRACARRCGETFLLRFPRDVSFVLTSDPHAIRRAFTAAPSEYEVREANQILRPILGDHSLLLLDGEAHLQERRLMTPPFHGERFQVYANAIREATESVMTQWPRGRGFPLHDQMQAVTLEVIMRAVFGITPDGQQATLRAAIPRLLDIVANPLIVMLAGTGEIRTPWFLRPFERWLPSRAFEAQRAEVDALLLAEFARRRADGVRGDDVLSMLLDARYENGEGLSDVALRDEMMTLLLAGHETSATTLAWAFSHVLRDAQVRQRLIDEVREVVGEEPITASHLSSLAYLDAVMRETLRITPILPFVGRKLVEPWEVGPYVVPSGSTLAPCVYLTHHRADLWPDPERFDPERFLDARIPPNAWFPFGGGARRCIGQAFAMFEMKIVLATVLQRVDLRLIPGYVPRVVRRSITLAPSRGVPVIWR